MTRCTQGLPKGNGLVVFNPGLYIIDRQNPEDDYINEEPHKISLCWNQPQLLIHLVEQCQNLNNLNLTGYEELTDLAMEYISGQIGECPGLKQLVELTLPKKCFVTIEGIRVLIENLLLIEVIKNAHSMGSMISKKYLSKNFGQRHFVLKEFSQLESMKSGRVESEEENEITGELEGWFPDERDLQHLIESFPLLKSIQLLMGDVDLYNMATILEDSNSHLEVEQMEIHLLNPNTYNTTGINRLAVTFANTLTSLKLTILDSLSWHSIEMIGKFCTELRLFHLELWDRIFTDNVQEINKPNNSEPHFTKLQDLKVNCEDYIEPLHLNMMKYFMNCDSSELKIFQYVAHLSWLNDDNFGVLWSHKALQSLEMIILHNVDSVDMNLGLQSVLFLIDQCPNLTILGNLRSWKNIDYYNINSSHFYRSESELSRLKEKITSENWDLDLDVENLNYLYT